MGLVTVGVDLGQKRNPTALCVVDAQRRHFHVRPQRPWVEVHFVVRYLERLPAGTSFPEVAGRLAEMVRAVARQTEGCRPQVYVNATGLGSSILDLLGEKVPRIVGCYFNHGDRRTVEGQEVEIRIGMCWLVARVQSLLQLGTLHLPKTPEADTLARELREYEISVSEDANERYGTFRVGTQDDLVTALGLAVQQDPPAPHTVMRRYALA